MKYNVGGLRCVRLQKENLSNVCFALLLKIGVIIPRVFALHRVFHVYLCILLLKMYERTLWEFRLHAVENKHLNIHVIYPRVFRFLVNFLILRDLYSGFKSFIFHFEFK